MNTALQEVDRWVKQFSVDPNGMVPYKDLVEKIHSLYQKDMDTHAAFGGHFTKEQFKEAFPTHPMSLNPLIPPTDE